jgi:hypothetical protein
MKRGLMAVAVGTAAAAAMVAYERWGRPWQEGWGAGPDERTLRLPGDELLAEPAAQLTRAITIAAPPEAVWPWIVQLGADRGGFYSYDWLENLFGLDIHSAPEIVDEWQALEVGDVVRANRKGTGGWYVVELRPNEALVLQVANLEAGRPARRDELPYWEFQWTFALRPEGAGMTRLLVRERVAFGRPLARVLMAPLGPASFVMTRRMLLGIKARAEAIVAGGRVSPRRRSDA